MHRDANGDEQHSYSVSSEQSMTLHEKTQLIDNWVNSNLMMRYYLTAQPQGTRPLVYILAAPVTC